MEAGKYVDYLHLETYKLIINIDLQFTLNELRLKLSLSKSILLFIPLNLYEITIKPIFDLFLSLKQKWLCRGKVVCSKLSWIHSLIGNRSLNVLNNNKANL
jgi:hypothetical protein